MSTVAPTTAERRDRFRALHATGLFVMPNPWDVGSARLLAGLGFAALATTSSGHAAALGRADQQVARDELLAHAAALAAAVDVPVSVDAERCFAADPTGVAETVGLLAGTGAAGCSIEDYDPATGRIDDLGTAPGLRSAAGVGRLVAGVGAPVNVLALPGAPAVAELAALGVRRVSTGGALARAAYAAAAAAARALGPVRVDAP